MDDFALPIPRVTEMRYSLTHDGWFWVVEVANPWPAHKYDSGPVRASGFAKRRKGADRAAERAIKKLNKRLSRAYQEMG